MITLQQYIEKLSDLIERKPYLAGLPIVRKIEDMPDINGEEAWEYMDWGNPYNEVDAAVSENHDWLVIYEDYMDEDPEYFQYEHFPAIVLAPTNGYM